jgi:hypothetical protein
MKLTKESRNLIHHIVNNNCVLSLNHSLQTKHLLSNIYSLIHNAVSYIKQSFIIQNQGIDKIENIGQIPLPQTFNEKAFPTIVRNHIFNNSLFTINYFFLLNTRKISFRFIVEEQIDVKLYDEYVRRMLVWLCMIKGNQCVDELTVYIYHISLTKTLPNSNIEILNEMNANTAFTTTCPKVSEIVIYRKEEWFKVFLHETFHNFGLDFSGMNIQKVTNHILELFPVNSNVNLFESYTEFWARVLNTLFISYYNSNNLNTYLRNAHFYLNIERIYSFYQMTKVLSFMGLTYKDLYLKKSKQKRDMLFKENTNIFSYYIITAVLMNNYQEFLGWCETNNKQNLFQFDKRNTTLMKFGLYIEQHYKRKQFLDTVECSQSMLVLTHNKNKSNTFLLNNLRMTLCEMG